MVLIYGQVSFAGSGVPTLSAINSKGIVSITRNGTGLYTFVFGTTSGSLDTYYHLGMVKHVFKNATAPAAPQMYIVADNSATAGTASIQLQFASSGSATDPGSGEVLLVSFEFQNSSAV